MRRPGRPSRRAVGYSALALAVAVATAVVLYFIYRTPSSASATGQRTVTVTRGTVQATVSASGSLSAVSTASENFTSGGTLKSLDVTVGEQVHAGQVLATLDSTQAGSAEQSAQTGVTVAQMNLANAIASYNNQQRTLDQAKAQLAVDESGGTTVQKDQNQESLDNAEQQLTNDQDQLAADNAQLASDQQALATAQSTYSADQLLGCPAAAPGSSSGATAQVTSSSGGPSVTTDGASGVSTTSAQLNATIDPNGAATSYYFDYGTSTAYGETSAVASLPSGTSPVTVSVTVSGLAADTTYLVTAVASNAAGSSVGIPVTFTTAQDDCTVEGATVTADEAKVTADQQQIAGQQTTISVQTLAVQVAEANAKGSPSTITADRNAITQDEASLAQSRVGLVQDRSALAQDEASLIQAETTLQETQLVALISGMVTSVDGTIGQAVSGGGSTLASSSSSSSSSSGSSGSGSALVTIVGLHQLEVVADFAEADALKVRPHQSAVITLPADPNTEVEGVVTSVSPVSTVTSNVVTYPVSIAVISPPSSVKDGMTADVSVVVQTATNVLELPSAAITTTGTVSTVEVLSHGKETATRVTLGVVGGTYTEVTSGVTEGETVVEPEASVSATTSGTTTGGFGGGGFGGGGFFRGGAVGGG